MKAILFDLDGTLLPMNEKHFIELYFKELVTVLSPLGVEPAKLVEALWTGTESMVKNNGERSNYNVFWETFERVTDFDTKIFKEKSEDFYLNRFKVVKEATKSNLLAKKAVELARKNDRKVVLATNPILPKVALIRLNWIGLSEDDFDYISYYENSSFAKPNPNYYLDICKRVGVEPEKCLMVGNDERDDMFAAESAGMNCFLVTDTLIQREEFSWNGERGTFEDLILKLENI